MAPKGSKYKVLTTADRKAAFGMLLMRSKNGSLEHGAPLVVAKRFSKEKKALLRLWKSTLDRMKTHLITIRAAAEDQTKTAAEREEAQKQINLLDNEDLDSLKLNLCVWPDSIFMPAIKAKSGRKRSINRGEMADKAREVKLNHRKTYRRLAKELGVSKSTIWRALREEGLFRRHTNALKPTLTEANKYARLVYALDQVDESTIRSRGAAKFKDMYDRVHIDEKWFFLCKDRAKYILVSDEEDPHRTVKHKSHITKVMFVCAQARPRLDTATGRVWDGKIGIWPVGKWVPAQRKSSNRARGTLEWKDENVTAEVYRNVLIEKVLPAIVDKWPKGEMNNNSIQIGIQQDGAKAHIAPTDSTWLDAVAAVGQEEKIYLYTQPANSPDTNLNDLGFFAALQSIYYEEAPSNATELIELVQKCFEDFDSKKINRIWLTYMSCLNQIIDHNGDNDYKIPHMKKAKLERENKLPRKLDVTATADELLDELFMVKDCEEWPLSKNYNHVKQPADPSLESDE